MVDLSWCRSSCDPVLNNSTKLPSTEILPWPEALDWRGCWRFAVFSAGNRPVHAYACHLYVFVVDSCAPIKAVVLLAVG